ncbi:MAG: hypothetical protein ACRCWG_17665 [Sarcina sp.]
MWNKYDIKIPILTKGMSFTDINLKISKDYEFSLNKEAEKIFIEIIEGKKIKIFESIKEEVCYHKIELKLIENKNNHKLMFVFKNIIAETEKYACEVALALANNFCEDLTFFFFVDSRERIEFYCDIFNFDIKMQAKDVNRENDILQLNDSINLKEELKIVPNFFVKVDTFYDTSRYIKESDLLSFIKRVIFNVANEKNERNIYFNLYSILEYIEINYLEHNNANDLFTQNELNMFDEIIAKELDTKMFDKTKLGQIDEMEKRKNIKGIILNSFKQMTYENKAQKLASTIQNRFKISKYYVHTEVYDINKSEMNSFIQLRNKLFHTSKNGENEKIETSLKSLNEKLLYFSLALIKAEINFVKTKKNSEQEAEKI